MKLFSKPEHFLTGRLIGSMSTGLVLSVLTMPLNAQTLVPEPIVTAYAGVAAGGPTTSCSTTSDIPNTYGTHLGDGCLPTQATLASVYGAFTDAAGNVYVTENGTNNDIRVIYKGGSVLTSMLIASNVTLSNFIPIPGRIYTVAGARPSALTVKNGTKYSCDGTTTGPQALDSAGDGCPATQAYLKVRGMWVDANGNIFLVSTGGGNVVKVIYAGGTQVANLIMVENPGVTPQIGYVYQLAGQSTASYGGDGGLAKSAALVVVRDVITDSYGNVFISDGTTPTTTGGTNTVAANNVRVIYGGVQAPAGMSNLMTGYIYTYAGGSGCVQGSASCTAGYSGDGGAATSALFNSPYTLFMDRFNNLYISDYTNDRVRVVYSGGTIPGITNPVTGYVYTFAGGGSSTTNGSSANQVKLGIVSVSGIDAAGNIYVEDGTSKVVWRFDALAGTGYITAGTGNASHAGIACSGTTGPLSTDNYGDGCPALQGAISDIGRISFDPQGNWYMGESSNAIVRKMSYNTQFTATAVGSASSQYVAYLSLGAATLASESFATQGAATNEFSDAGTGTCTATSVLAATQTCTFGVTFTPTHAGLRQASQTLSTATTALNTSLLSGVGLASDLAIDPGTQATAGTGLMPTGIASDLLGNIFVANSTNNLVLKGTASGTTLTNLITGLNKPYGIALDAIGNLYIADSGNNRVLKTTATGNTITTLGTTLSGPRGVAVDALGNVFIADTGNNRIVEIATNGVQRVAPLTGLSTPTQLCFDSNGDLFVVDTGNSRIVELPTNGNQTVVSLATGVVPTSVAVDSAGTIYITDATSKQLQLYPAGSASYDTLLSGLITPVGLSADPDGNLFLTDSGASSAIYVRRGIGNIAFPVTNVNSSSTSSINLSNVGNVALSFPSAPLFSLTNPSGDFSIATATTNGCAIGVNYAAGTGCNFTATFQPSTKGTYTANATFNTNATNTGAVNAQLSGSGLLLVATTTTISVTSPTGSISYGQAVTLTATVTQSSNVGTPAGTITFTVNGKAQTPQPYGNGTVTLTLNPAVGTEAVSISYSGDGVNYASSATSTSFTVNQASTKTTLTVAPQNANGTVSLVFSAAVNSSTAIGETGTVSFYAGTQLLTTVSLSATTATASYTTSTLSYANNSFTAVYNGDINFAASTSTAQTPVSDFTIGSSISRISTSQGGVATISYVIASLYGSTGTIIPSCSGLPANSSCAFQPTTITLSGSTAVQLLIYTNVSTGIAKTSGPYTRDEILLASLLPLALLFARRRSRKLGSVALAGLITMLMLSTLNGCGSGSAAAKSDQGLVTPAGTSTVTVTFAGASPLATHTNTFTFTVLQNTTTF